MLPESAVPAAREHPLAFEEHCGNLLHAVGPDRASKLQLHAAQRQPPGLPREEVREGGGRTGIARG